MDIIKTDNFEFALWLAELTLVLCDNLGVGWGGRWEGGSRGRGHMYTYGWSMLLYGRNQHNIVKQLLGWGTHVNPWLIHVNVWQKPLQYCKVISLQLIKIKKNKKEKKSILQLKSIKKKKTACKSHKQSLFYEKEKKKKQILFRIYYSKFYMEQSSFWGKLLSRIHEAVLFSQCYS